MDVIGKVEQTIREEQVLAEEDGIVVAVSGGPDSMALLHILFLLSARWKWRLVVAHFNHRFRGAESDREAAFVAEEARRLGLPFELGEADVPGYARSMGLNPQAAAREKRYAFLEAAAARHGSVRVATAHHADDQAETVLLHFLRGSGAAGLGGIPFTRRLKKMELVRPFLRITKRELLSFCKERGVPYCEDSSNRKTEYARNRIRLELMPVLQAYNPALTDTLLRLADTMREEEAFMAEEAAAVFARTAVPVENGWAFSAAACASLPIALQRRFVKLILEYLSTDMAEFGTVEAVRDAALQSRSPSLSLDLGGGVRFVREYDSVRLTNGLAEQVPNPTFAYEWRDLSEPLEVMEAGARFHAEWKDGTAVVPKSGQDEAWFDAAEVRLPLRVRSRQDGDRLLLPGVNGSKKVKDILIDAKIPPSMRSRLPLVFDATGMLLWLPGIRRSSVAPVTSDTRSRLHLFLTRDH